jgi:hypothetical protein
MAGADVGLTVVINPNFNVKEQPGTNVMKLFTTVIYEFP